MPLDGIFDPGVYHREMMQLAASQRTRQTQDATLGMQDFIRLMVAQLQNQDMMNPMDNTEFISQMATFSSLTAMNNIVDQTMTAYAVSLLGKEVIVAEFNNMGQTERHEGVVTGISLFEGAPRIFIGDRSFDLRSIMAVGALPDRNNNDDSDKNDHEVRSLIGSFANVDALNAARVTGNAGDQYRIENDIWAWSSTTNSWVVARQIKGAFDNEAELNEAYPVGILGDAYLVGNDIFAWSVASERWIRSGSILGSFDTERALIAANQRGNPGDAFLIGNNEIWSWSTSSKGWTKAATVLGDFTSDVALRTAHPTGSVGDAYRVAGDIFIWSAVSNRWVDIGR